MPSYIDGGFQVQFDLETGEKKIERISNEVPEFPGSVDLKVTDFCNAGCSYCHENSTPRGKHAELEPLLRFLNVYPEYREIAIGGGNPLDWPSLDAFLLYCKDRNIICNITVNKKHMTPFVINKLKKFQSEKLIYGIGISSFHKSDMNSPLNCMFSELKNVVMHHIIGITPTLKILNTAFKNAAGGDSSEEVGHLFLGYKEWGRGEKKNPNVANEITKFSWSIKTILEKARASNKIVVFDNLAIKQLDLENRVPKEIWEKSFMGEDGIYSGYIDAVKQTYSRTSYSPNRRPWTPGGISEAFLAERAIMLKEGIK